ncbi:MAG: glycosyltransferase [Planctomycetota bacterium]|nr:glycosyltransferase [Planctomycetota bacterium]
MPSPDRPTDPRSPAPGVPGIPGKPGPPGATLAPDAPGSEAPRPRRPVVGQVLHRLQVAGAEVLAADLARRLRDRFDFVFLCLDGVGPLGEALAAEGFPVEDLRRRSGIDLALARRLRAAVRDHGVELLHAHQYTPFFYAALSRRLAADPPILFTEHGRHYPDQRKLRHVLFNRLLLRRGDRVTAVGGFVKKALVGNEGIRASRIEIVRNGIDPQRFVFDPRPSTRAAVRMELGLASDQPVVLQVARFHPVKDHTTAVRAVAEVVEELPGAALLLAGDGPERAHIEALAAQLEIAPNVRFLGVRSDIPRLMAAADVFMLSSLSEGISVTLLEAMGCALPIVATDVGGNAEVIGNDEAGLLSPRERPAPLADNILRLLRDASLRQRLGQAGRQRLLGQFTQDRMHARYAELYHQMAGT